jgi:ribosome-associated protein
MDDIEAQAVEKWVKKNIRMSFSLSGGPGGQNVNKVNTKVTARVRLSSMDFLEDEDLQTLLERLESRVNRDGDLVVQVTDTKSQAKNRELAVLRATAMIQQALKRQKKRRSTRVPPPSKEKRIKDKKLVARKKRLRGTMRGEDVESDK